MGWSQHALIGAGCARIFADFGAPGFRIVLVREIKSVAHGGVKTVTLFERMFQNETRED